MKKRSFLALLIMVMLVLSCGKKENSEVSGEKGGKADGKAVNLKSLKGLPAISMVKLYADNEEGKTLNKYDASIVASVDEAVAAVAKKDFDIITIPANLASVMYNKTEGQVKIASILALNVLYVVENGDSVKSIQDLKGKTVYTFGKGATPEIVLNYVLRGNGLEPGKDVKIEFKSESAEVAAALQKESNVIAMLPEPFLSATQMKNPKMKVAFSMGDEWDKVKGTIAGSQVSGVVIMNREFADKNPEAVKNFMKDYKASVDFLSSSLDEAAKLTAKYDLVPEAVAKVSIPRANIRYITGSEMKEKMSEYLRILGEADMKTIGGKMPGDDFYLIVE